MKVYVLEDEVLILKHLMGILEEVPYLQVVGFANEVKKATQEIPALKPDLILADIRLKDGESFEIFSKIEPHNFQIIFLTAYDEYAIQALNLGALSYLLKPIDEDELRRALDKSFKQKEQDKFEKQQLHIAQQHLNPNDAMQAKRIALKSMEYIDIVPVMDIMYCKSDKGYTTFFLKDGNEILVSKVLKEYEGVLVPMGFVRSHQSYLVNLNYVKKYYKEGYLLMENETHIPVSSRKKEEIVQSLENI